jgi:hypothetical protein
MLLDGINKTFFRITMFPSQDFKCSAVNYDEVFENCSILRKSRIYHRPGPKRCYLGPASIEFYEVRISVLCTLAADYLRV